MNLSRIAMLAMGLAPVARAQSADLFLTGGKIITVDAADRVAQAVAIRGDRITASCSRTGSGQARQPRAARRRGASGLTRARPWTTPNNRILSGYSGATTVADATHNADRPAVRVKVVAA